MVNTSFGIPQVIGTVAYFFVKVLKLLFAERL